MVSQDDLTPDIQRAIFDFARRDNDQNLLLALIRRADAPIDLLARYAKLTAAPLKVAYLSRPDHSLEDLERVVACEKRATVLAVVAASPESSPALLLAISRDGRRAPSLAVLANPKAPLAARREALLALAPGFVNLSYAHQKQVTNQVAAATELHDELVAVSDNPDLLRVIIDAGELSLASLERATEVLVTGPLGEAEELPSSIYRSNWLKRSALTDAGRIVSAPNCSRELTARIVTAITPLTATGSTHRTEAAALLALLHHAGDDDSPHARLLAARTSDPDRLTALATSLKPGDADDAAVARALANNPTASTEVLESTVVCLSLADARKLLAAHPEVGRTVLAKHPSLLTHDALKKLGEPSVVAADLLPEFVRAHNLPALHTLLRLDVLDVDDLMAVPWSALVGFLTSGSTTKSPAHLRTVSDIVITRLGAEMENWRLFETFAEQFDGSFRDLLDAIDALARTAA